MRLSVCWVLRNIATKNRKWQGKKPASPSLGWTFPWERLEVWASGRTRWPSDDQLSAQLSGTWWLHRHPHRPRSNCPVLTESAFQQESVFKLPALGFFVCTVFFKEKLLPCACMPAQSSPTLCDLLDCGPPGSCIHVISQARILEWVATSFS